MPIAELREKLRARFATEFPGVSFSFEPADIVSRVMSLGSPTPIKVAVSGKDFAASRAHAETLRAKLAELGFATTEKTMATSAPQKGPMSV
jgi:multidrug efflux pump subunit AcrB